jgi:TonB family protein
LEQVISAKSGGAKAGVVWQLTECDERNETEGALPACAEFIAQLPDNRRVFITIRVGTFKEGLIGKPAFFSAAIEQEAEFYTVRQLSDLPEMLRARGSVSNGFPNKRPGTKTKNRVVTLPPIKADQVKLVTISSYPLSGPPNFPAPTGMVEAPPPPPLQKVSESILQSRVIKRVNPVYPSNVRKLNATGTVEVEVTISEVGLVLEARAISGHLALRSAAVEAARKWIFKPAILNNSPVKIKGVLTFTFGPDAK